MSPADGGNAPFRAGQRLTLHLGVLVQPYRARGKKVGALNTGDVAEILEAKYGIMNAFVRVHGDVIGGAIAQSLDGAMESLLMGQRVDPFGTATQIIQSRFQDFINSKEVETVGLPGVPTKAALRGVNHRRKHPYAKGPRRPSFRDTGMYVGSARVWTSS